MHILPKINAQRSNYNTVPTNKQNKKKGFGVLKIQK